LKQLPAEVAALVVAPKNVQNAVIGMWASVNVHEELERRVRIFDVKLGVQLFRFDLA
jgi:hypothetical protein